MKNRHSKMITCAIALIALFPAIGCERALGLQDWQRDVLGVVLNSVLLNAAVPTQVVVERTCFENGVQVDCSQIPAN